MLEPKVSKVLDLLGPSALVLEIGGLGRPFNRADFVLNAEPYETRGYYGSSRPAQGGAIPQFRQETWIRRDICDREPYPFADKQLGFVIRSHTLEDVRDPDRPPGEICRLLRDDGTPLGKPPSTRTSSVQKCGNGGDELFLMARTSHVA